jgi:hypothetical protein
MKRIDLVQLKHDVKIGDVCGDIEPNVTEDSIFYFDGEPIGFYIADLSKNYPKGAQLADIADKELRSKNVPKSVMKRSSGFGDGNADKEVLQYSTIIGSVPPKPHMRRPYPTISSVHNVKTAKTFIKAMMMLCLESEKIIKELTPNLYEQQKELIKQNVPEKWRFGNLFTSSISNYNIPAAFHRDAANIEGCANVIIAKRKNSTGGHTTVPDYGATVNSADNSMLVYPAWRNVHGVTPIVPTYEGGYRNTLVFYPLKVLRV